jgi:thioredoxin reductase
MTEPVDVAVVGAGPAGIAAAVVAAESGARVVLIDAGPGPGGQYYRQPAPELLERPGDPPPHRWREFDELHARLRRQVAEGRASLLTDTTVWAAERPAPFLLRTRPGDRERKGLGTVRCRTVVVATGAFDRHLPFPGWDLPGVMSGGAAQALVKGSRVRPGRAVVVAGTGPFLLAVAATVLEAGGRVVAVVEANAPETLAPRLLTAAGKAGQLAKFVALLARHRVPYLRRHRVVRAIGGEALETVVVARVDRHWRARPGSEQRLHCDTLAVGYGFTAQTDLLLQLGCPVVIGADGGLAVGADALQQTGVPGVLTAGETTGVGGADLALLEGLVAGAGAARHCGISPTLGSADLARLRRRIARLRRFARALHRTFPVRDGWQATLNDDTVVCRCEEVAAGEIRHAIHKLGARDPRTVKLLSRAGMGWCQGRICGFAVDQLCATLPGVQADDPTRLAAASTRPVAVPVRLADIAAMAPDTADRDSGDSHLSSKKAKG